MYKKTEWKDHIVEYPERFIISANQDETSTITKAQGQIMQDGTPVNAENLNKIEQGIFDNAEAIIENKTNIQANTQAIANKTNRRWVCDVRVDGWVENNDILTQEINCEGLTDDVVLIGDIYSIQTDNVDDLMSTFNSYKCTYRIESMNGKIKIYANAKPTKTFQMQFIEVAKV